MKIEIIDSVHDKKNFFCLKFRTLASFFVYSLFISFFIIGSVIPSVADPVVNWTIESQNRTEDVGAMTITAELSGTSSLDVTVPFSISGTAADPNDYTITPSPVVIPALSLSANITITVADDGIDENDETVIVTMGSPTNATKGTTDVHTATITDNDAQPEVYWTLGSQSEAEGVGTMTITAQISAASGLNVTIPFSVSGTATDPDDYTITGSPITIPAGSLSTNITIMVAEDSIDENDETVIVTMGAPTNATQGATDVHTATITDNDAQPEVNWTAGNQSESESVGTMTITAQISSVSGLNVTVPFSVLGTATNQNDYTITGSPITIPAGLLSTNITIAVADDGIDENDETVVVIMGAPTNATQGTTDVHTATITDNDAQPEVNWTTGNQSESESVGTMTITAQISSVSGLNVTVPFSVSGTAINTNDYTITGNPITIPAGSLSTNINITVVDDVIDENNETVIVTMGVPTNATKGPTDVHTATIADNDAQPEVNWTSGSQSRTEGVGTMTVTAQLSSTSAFDVTVPFSISGTAIDPNDYTITASPVFIPAGSPSANITITVVDDSFNENNETVIVTMGVPTNATKGSTDVHTGTIVDNDASPEVNWTAGSQGEAEDVGTMTITAQLSAVSELDVTIPYNISGTATNPNDFTITPSPIVIPAGLLTTNITITVADDSIDENDETMIVTMGAPTNATQGTTDVHTATITDNDAQPEVNWTSVSQGEAEDVGTMTITAELSAVSGLNVTVPYSVSGTANNPNDYTITPSPIVIPAGSLTTNITITVADDGIDENDETVIVTMGSPTNATKGATDIHTATITDNDAQPDVNWTIGSQSGAEGTGTMTITAQLSAASGLNVTIPYSVSGTANNPNDYTITGSPITIPAGSLTTNITISVAEDSIDENDETVIVTMGSPTNAMKGATDIHTATITDNDAQPDVNWTIGSQSGAENTGTMTITAQLSAVSGLNVTIPYSVSGTASNPNDYTITGSPITIPAGSLSTNITITVANDSIDENDETVIITMGSPTNAMKGATDIHTATIIDNDAQPEVNWTIGSQSGAENTGTMTISAQLSAISGLNVTIPYSVSGTASNPNDYTITGSPITIPAGSLTTNMTITVADDSIDENAETVIVTMGAPTNATQGAIDVHTATITDNDAQPEVNWTIGSQSGAENIGTMTITAQLSAVSGLNVIIPYSVSGTATNPDDYTITVSPITIPAGSLTTNITITVVDDGIDENAETVIVTMGALTNATKGATDIHTATITDNDAQPVVNWTSGSQSGAEGTGTMTITAQLSAVSGLNVIIPYSVSGTASNPDDYTITVSPITIPAGSLTTNITITVVDDAIDENDETVIVTMGAPINATKGATDIHTATITDNDAQPVVNWTSGSQSGAEGTGTMTITAQLSAVSGLDVTVPYSVSGTATNPDDYTITVSPITIPAGSLTTNITITVVDDAIDENDETVIVTMGAPTNATQGTTDVHAATITDNDAQPVVNWTSGSQSGAEGTGTMTITAQLSAVSGLNVTVPFIASGTASNPDDYTLTLSPITIPAGSLTANITITVVDDVIDENDEAVIVTMVVPINATKGGTDVHTATITDNDAQPVVSWTIANQSGAEGVGTMSLTAQLSAVSGLNVIIPFGVSGTATNPDDYSITGSPVTITAGSLTTNVTITVADDGIDENDETVIVTIGVPTNATKGAIDVHTATIIDNDAQPVVSWTIANQSRAENIGTMTITAQLSAVSGLNITIPFSVSGTAIDPDDYTITASPIVIPAGSLSGNIIVTVVDDIIDEGDETVIVTMDAPTDATKGVTDIHTATINDNNAQPVVSWTSGSQSEAEGAGVMTITAQLSVVSGLDVTIPFSVSGSATNPNDYTITASPITILAGSLTTNITITVADDGIDENDETVIVTMGAPTNATQGATDVHTATITDNDISPEVNWTSESQSGDEGVGTMTITAQLSAVSGLDVSVPFNVSGTPTDPNNYTITASPITIPAGSLSANITITVIDDNIDENNNIVIVTIDSPTNATKGATDVHTAIIMDNDEPPEVNWTTGSQSGAEGAGTMTITPELSAVSGLNVTVPFSISGTATNPDDYTITGSPITIPAGSLTTNITVTVVNDGINENAETVIVTMGAPINATKGANDIHTATITDNDGQPVVNWTTGSQSGAEGVGTMTITAQLSAVSGLDVTVPFSVSGTATDPDDYTIAGSPITILAGSLTTNITITVADDGINENDETVIVTMGFPINATQGITDVHTATITDNDAQPVVNWITGNQSEVEGIGTMTVTAQLSAISGLDVTVPFSVSGTATDPDDYTIAGSPVTILAGSLTTNITITVADDGIDENDETVIVTMGAPTNATQGITDVHTATITDNDAQPVVNWTTGSQSEVEGTGTMTVTIQLSAISGLDVTVPFSVSGTATDPDDYTITGSPVTILAGSLTTNITITVADDGIDENDETVIVTMGAPTNATQGATNIHTATITDNDTQPEVNWTIISQNRTESVGTMTITAQLSAVSGLNVTIPFSVSGTATDPDDYLITASPITIPAGSLSTNITITVTDDGIDENNETVIVTMGVPTNATKGVTDEHTANIADNNSQPEVNWTSGSQSGTEGIGTMTITAQLSAVSGLDVTVPFSVSGTATDPDDYTITASPIFIPTGSLSANITITVVDDSINENDETVIITMGAPINAIQGATNVHTANIVDNNAQPEVNWTSGSQSEAENIGTMTITAQLSAVSGLDVTVPFSVSGMATNPDDYTITESPIMIPAGSPSGNITITVMDDGIDENDEALIVTMGAPSNATQGATDVYTATITDNDAQPEVNWTTGSQSGTEGVGTMMITVQLSSVSGFDVTVPFNVSGMPTDPNNYTITASPVTIPAGSISADIIITVVDDGIDENDETLIVTMGAPINATQGTTNVHTATITDNDAQPEVNWTSGSQSRTEGVGAMTITAQLSEVSGLDIIIPFNVSGIPTDPNNYIITASPVTISAGSLSADITITVVDDNINENDGAVIVTMGIPINAVQGITNVHAATIIDNDAQPEVNWTAGSQSGTEGAGAMTITARLSSVSGLDVTIPFGVSGTATGPDDYTITANLITILAGSLSADITITLVDDSIDEDDETLIVTMGSPTNATQGNTNVHTATINDNDTAAVTITESDGSTDVHEDGVIDTYDVVLDSMPVSDVTITLTPDIQTTVNPVHLIFTPTNWNITQQITVVAVDDSIYEGSHVSEITHTAASADPEYNGPPFNGSGNPYILTVNITDNDLLNLANSTVTVDPSIVVADGKAFSTITVILRDSKGLPVPGKKVVLESDRGSITQPTIPTDSNGVAVGRISSEAFGFATIIATDETDGIVISEQPQVLFVQNASLEITKTANKTSVVVGDIVIYRIVIRNKIKSDAVQVLINDLIPPNFKYIKGSARLNGARMDDPSGNQRLSFDIGTVTGLVDIEKYPGPGEPGYLTLDYQLIVGSGARPGEYRNMAVARDACDKYLDPNQTKVPITEEVCDTYFISNQTEVPITVTLDPVFDLGTIIGKVFEDRNLDGVQGADEPGIRGIMVALDDGTYVLTDDHGRYHFPAVKPGHRMVKINLNDQWERGIITTDESHVVWVTPGILAKVNFGVSLSKKTESIGRDAEHGLILTTEIDTNPLMLLGSVETLTLSMNGQILDLPRCGIRMGGKKIEEVVEIKGLQLDEPVVFHVDIVGPGKVKKWEINILDSKGNIIRIFVGEGKPPETVFWDRLSEAGYALEGGEIYQYQMEVEYLGGSHAKSARRLFSVREINTLSIALSGGAFDINSAKLSPDARKALKKIAGILRKYPDKKIAIEGYTDSSGTDTYNFKLSKERAEEALSYLVNQEGIPASSIEIGFYGEYNPIASNNSPEGRELNRRIEINGSFKEVWEAKIYNQFRTNPIVVIDKSSLKVDQYGRFQMQLEKKDREEIDIEMCNAQGKSIQTKIFTPRLDILKPTGEQKLAYRLIKDGNRVNHPPDSGQWGKDDVVMVCLIVGQTDPENIVELENIPVVVESDGTFSVYVDLELGKNIFGFMIKNPFGYTRLANLILTVKDKDDNGRSIIVVDPIPRLTVNLPPGGSNLSSFIFTVSGITDPANKIQINEKAVPLEPDGSFAYTMQLTEEKSLLAVKVEDPQGYSGSIEREVEVKKNHLFFLAFADGKVGMLHGSGNLRGAGMDEKTEFFTEGRIAYYLKGIIAGKYLIKSAFDTGTNKFEKLFEDLDEAETERLLTNLDPDKFYPVYGDESTVTYDTDSQGKFYLAVDSDALHFLVGNYPLQYTDTELAAYQRTLFGGQVLYQSVSRTKYGQPDTVIAVFGAETRHVHVRNHLRATGGSIYFLSHQHVIEGSEQVTLELRDKNTGLILARVPQQQNVDYTIKYEEGRILFNRPLSSVLEDERLVDQVLLSGNPVFIQIDYETQVQAFENTAVGSRVRQQVGDHIGIGMTYVKDELELGDYKLKGVDTEVRVGKNTRIVGEYAESSGTDSLTFVSEDGGVTYIEETPNIFEEGKAWKVGADMDIGEWLGAPDRIQIGGYLKKLEPGFLSSGNFSEAGTKKYGGKMKLQLTQKDKILARYDREEFDDVGLAETEQSDMGTLQWHHEQDKWSLTGEYQIQESKDGSGSSMESSSFAAGRFRFNPLDRLTTELEHQQTITGPHNNQTMLGTEYQVNSILSLKASGTAGTLGNSLQGGTALNLDRGRLYLTERLSDDQSGHTTSTVFGAERAIGPESKIYSEYQWDRSDNGDRALSLMGAQWNKDLTKGFTFLLGGEYTEIDSDPQTMSRHTITTGLTFAHPSGIKASTRDEIRKEHGNKKLTQFLTSNRIELKVNPDFTLLGKYRYSKTRDESTGQTEARFEERSIGLAYRPVKNDRFNALTRYTQLFDHSPLTIGETEALETKRDVASLEWSLDLNRYLEWVTKEAAKLKWEKTIDGAWMKTHTYLSIQRLNFHLWKRIDFGTEYRILLQKESDDHRQGWLTEFTWEAVKHLRLGVGFNFTDFSDNEFSDNNYSVYGWFFRIQGRY